MILVRIGEFIYSSLFCWCAHRLPAFVARAITHVLDMAFADGSRFISTEDGNRPLGYGTCISYQWIDLVYASNSCPKYKQASRLLPISSEPRRKRQPSRCFVPSASLITRHSLFYQAKVIKAGFKASGNNICPTTKLHNGTIASNWWIRQLYGTKDPAAMIPMPAAQSMEKVNANQNRLKTLGTSTKKFENSSSLAVAPQVMRMLNMWQRRAWERWTD